MTFGPGISPEEQKELKIRELEQQLREMTLALAKLAILTVERLNDATEKGEK